MISKTLETHQSTFGGNCLQMETFYGRSGGNPETALRDPNIGRRRVEKAVFLERKPTGQAVAYMQ